MKRTAYLIENAQHESGWLLSKNKITCELTGEMNDGTKIWQDTTSGLGKLTVYNSEINTDQR